MVPKKTEFGGKYKPIPIIIGNSQGRSATFVNAQNNQTAAVIDSFLLTRVSDYSIATIDNQTMLASKTDKMAFLEGAKVVIDGAISQLVDSLAGALFRNGTGSIGQVSGSITSGVIQLADVNSVTQFELNMTLQANSSDGGTPRAALGYVIAVDRSLGKITVASSGIGGSAATPSGWSASDYLLVQGDNNAKISGLLSWLPTSAPGATSFFGVDRSVDTVRLGGVRFDGSSESIEEALVDCSSLLAREGGKPDVAIMNYTSWGALEKSLGTKVQYVDAKGPADIMFRGILVNGANSQIKVFPDRSQTKQRCHLLTMKNWCLNSLGDAPQILRYGDGLEMLRVANADAAEVRVGYYANLSCNAPGWSANLTLSS